MGGIWAVARNLIREVFRMRFLMVFVILATAAYTVGFAVTYDVAEPGRNNNSPLCIDGME